MGPMCAVMGREFGSYFRTPLGWLVVALFLALSSVVFSYEALVPGQVATLRPFFGSWWLLLLLVAPAISMRLISEETRTGTLEPIRSAPIGEASFVVGKYLAGVLFICAMLLPTLVYVGVMLATSSPDLGPIVSGYLGVVLLGAMYLSIGLLMSAMTSSQTLAFLAAFLLLLGLNVGVTMGAAVAPEWLRPWLMELSPQDRLRRFAMGLIDLSDVAYFVAVSAWFVVLTIVWLEVKRWK